MSEDEFERYLNFYYDDVEVFGNFYEMGTALRALDPVAFRQAYLDYLDAEGLEEE